MRDLRGLCECGGLVSAWKDQAGEPLECGCGRTVRVPLHHHLYPDHSRWPVIGRHRDRWAQAWHHLRPLLVAFAGLLAVGGLQRGGGWVALGAGAFVVYAAYEAGRAYGSASGRSWARWEAQMRSSRAADHAPPARAA